MADTITFRLWTGRAIYVALAISYIFVRLLPLDTTPSGLPGPDLLICITFAWVLRRPDHVPPLLIAAIFLLCDLIFMRPPGLWTLMILAATEFLRAREGLMRELPFLMEWVMVSAVLLAATLGQTILLAIFMVPDVTLGIALLHILVTLLAYPIVVATLWLALGLRRAAPGEVDRLGRKI